MESNYFEKIQKRFEELTKKAAALELGGRFWLSLKRELPNVPEDTYCTDKFMVRFNESIYKGVSIKSIEYRRYNEDTGKWSDWQTRDFEYSDFMEDVVFQGKEIYILNMENNEKSYDYRHITLYAPELLKKTYVSKSDESKQIKIFPWVYIDVEIGTADDGFVYPTTPVEARICSWHKTSGDYEEARRRFAEQLVDGYHEVYHIDRGDADSHPKIVKEVEDLLDDGQLPIKMLNAKIYGNYDYVMFTPQQGLAFADERLPIIEKKYREIMPEWKKLKAIVEMSDEEKAQYLAEEKKKEQEDKKKKAAERAEKKRIQEEEDKKKSRINYIGLAVFFITLGLCYIPTEFVESNFINVLIDAAIITIVVVCWKTVKKQLKKKWGMKESE